MSMEQPEYQVYQTYVVKSSGDPEINVMTLIKQVLGSLTTDERRRVLAWLLAMEQ